ncbi:hypothetical protein HK414_15965 [Ramlibacter terrae]|uniref:Uncharacterized protein n=1 Tax=Ramlibacter terrae TaxID=2732511 RepID=A0ABX6P3L6_9BURK|nr:hypothetical protein HK414_15965 [Ramlibacter terrae]
MLEKLRDLINADSADGKPIAAFDTNFVFTLTGRTNGATVTATAETKTAGADVAKDGGTPTTEAGVTRPQESDVILANRTPATGDKYTVRINDVDYSFTVGATRTIDAVLDGLVAAVNAATTSLEVTASKVSGTRTLHRSATTTTRRSPSTRSRPPTAPPTRCRPPSPRTPRAAAPAPTSSSNRCWTSSRAARRPPRRKRASPTR